MDIRETDIGIEAITSTYRLLLERTGGFALRQVEIFGPGRLDRFPRAGPPGPSSDTRALRQHKGQQRLPAGSL